MNSEEIRKIIQDFHINKSIETPIIKFSANILKKNIAYFKKSFQAINPEIFFPVKTNNHISVLEIIAKLGLNFEIASLQELQILSNLNISPNRIIFSNPVKIIKHIKFASQYGIETFAFDSYEELDKLAKSAPNSNVYARLSVDNSGSSWRLDEKFGVEAFEVEKHFIYAIKQGLNPVGLSFHVGWNNLNVETWHKSVIISKKLIENLRKKGIKLSFLNIGGGFPAHLCNPYENLKGISNKISTHLLEIKTKYNMQVYCEPGSFLTANAGLMLVTIYQVLKRNNKKWLYVDSGICQGFYWILSGINYEILSLKDSVDNKDIENYVVCGPTCDSHDIFSKEVMLPKNIKEGDVLLIRPAGAYISSSINYNGFTFPDTEIV